MLRAKGTDRLLDVLDCVMAQGTPMSRNAIAAAIKAPRSTVYSIIELMVARDYLEMIPPEDLIVPGSKCGLLGLAHDKHASFGRKARQVIGRLARQAGETAELNVVDGWRQIVFISETGRGHNYRLAVEGSSAALPCTASGRFLLRETSRAEIAANIPRSDFIMADGSKLTPTAFCDEIALAQAQGYWIATGLIDPYIACIAAPVRDRDGHCRAAVCLVVPIPELTQRETELVQMTRATAEEMTQLLKATNQSLQSKSQG